jgi:hypothetical protein
MVEALIIFVVVLGIGSIAAGLVEAGRYWRGRTVGDGR